MPVGSFVDAFLHSMFFQSILRVQREREFGSSPFGRLLKVRVRPIHLGRFSHVTTHNSASYKSSNGYKTFQAHLCYKSHHNMCSLDATSAEGSV